MRDTKKVLSVFLCLTLLLSTIVICNLFVSAEYEEPWVDNGNNRSTGPLPDCPSPSADWKFYYGSGILFNTGNKDIPSGAQTSQITVNGVSISGSTRTFIVDEGIKNIGSGATTSMMFLNGSGTNQSFNNLVYVYISSSVESIGERAFSGETVQEVYIYSTDCSISSTAFNSTCTIYGYAGSSAEAYADLHNLTFIEFDETMFDKVYNYKEPTCTESGYSGDIVYPWNFLKERGHTTDPLGHDEITHEGKAATCTESGWEPYVTCSRCDYSTYKVIEPTGIHSWKYSTDKYTITASCEKCDKEFSVTAVLPEVLKCSDTPKAITLDGEVPDGFVTDITYETEDGQAPKKAGKYTAHVYLRPDDLSDVILASINIELNIEHDLTSYSGKEATCTEPGYEPYEACSYCGYTTYTDIPEKNHDYSFSYVWSDDGKSCVATATCANDENHNFSEEAEISSAVKAAPTCEEDGTTTYTATFTNEMFETQTKDVKDISASGHEYTASYEWSADGKSCVATATCANDSSHTFSEIATVSSAVKEKPTCTEKGTTTYTAAFNNKFFCAQTKDVKTPATGHFETTIPAKEATCSEKGLTEGSRCSVCGKTLVEQKETPVIDHSDADNNGYCDMCKQMMTGGNHCVHCGQIHTGFFGGIIAFFHRIAHIFSR